MDEEPRTTEPDMFWPERSTTLNICYGICGTVFNIRPKRDKPYLYEQRPGSPNKEEQVGVMKIGDKWRER